MTLIPNDFLPIYAGFLKSICDRMACQHDAYSAGHPTAPVPFGTCILVGFGWNECHFKLIRLYTTSCPSYANWPHFRARLLKPNVRCSYRAFWTFVTCQQRRLLLWTHGSVLYGTCIACASYWNQSFSLTCHDFLDVALRTFIGTFLILRVLLLVSIWVWTLLSVHLS